MQGDVSVVQARVLEPAEAVGEGDFFDFGGEAVADTGDREGFSFGGDSVGLLSQGADAFPIGKGAPVVASAVVVVGHLLEDFDCLGVGIYLSVCSSVFLHTGELGLP